MGGRFKPAVDIWTLTASGLVEDSEPIRQLKRGQWVTAGRLLADRSNLGIFCGVRPTGVVVVAWLGNARNRGGSYHDYLSTLMQYGKGQA